MSEFKVFGKGHDTVVDPDRTDIDFGIEVTRADTDEPVMFNFTARGMVKYKVIRDIGLKPGAVAQFFDDTLLREDGNDVLPEQGDDEPDEEYQAKWAGLDPGIMSSRARWWWLWSDQDVYDVLGGDMQKVLEYIYGKYQDRHGIERFPTERSGRSSNGQAAKTGRGSAAKHL